MLYLFAQHFFEAREVFVLSLLRHIKNALKFRPATSEIWGLTVENPKDILCINEPDEVKRLLAQELARNPISTVSKKATLWTRGTMHGLGDICLAEIFKYIC